MKMKEERQEGIAKTAKISLTKDLLEDLYIRRKLGTLKIEKETGWSHGYIRRKLRDFEIPIRSISEALTRSDLTKDLLEDFYIKQRLGIYKIAERAPRSPPTIYRSLVKYGIPLRGLSEANMKYPKTPFSCDIHERAHLLGLRASDAHARKAGRQIEVRLNTTVPSMAELFETVFGRYGHIWKSPQHNGSHIEWALSSLLHGESFDWILEKQTKVPEEVKSDRAVFMWFLAGYTDSNGSLGLYRVDRHYIFRTLRIGTQDIAILNDVKKTID